MSRRSARPADSARVRHLLVFSARSPAGPVYLESALGAVTAAVMADEPVGATSRFPVARTPGPSI